MVRVAALYCQRHKPLPFMLLPYCQGRSVVFINMPQRDYCGRE